MWFSVFRFELMQQIRRKAFLFTAFGIPLILLAVAFGYVAIQEVHGESDDEPAQSNNSVANDIEGQARVGFVDETGLFRDDPQAPFSAYLTRYDNLADGQAALDAEDIQSLYVIESDYFQTGNVTHWLRTFSANDLDSTVMEAYLFNELGEGIEPELLVRLRVPITKINTTRINTDGGDDSGSGFEADFAQIYAFALLLMMGLYGSSGYLMTSVVTEKESKTIEIILTSVRPLPLLIGKVLAMGVAGLISIGAWIGAIALVASQVTDRIEALAAVEVKPETIVIALIYFLLGYGFMGAIWAAMGAVTNTVREGSMLAGWMVFPVIIPLLVITEFVNDPNGTLAVTLSMIPFTAPLAMVMRSSISSVPLSQLLISIGLMTVLVIAGIWVASRLFRVNTLLSGTTPRLRELPGLFLRG